MLVAPLVAVATTKSAAASTLVPSAAIADDAPPQPVARFPSYLICLASTPWRVAHLGPVLDTLLAQKPPPATIIVSAPKTISTRPDVPSASVEAASILWARDRKYSSVRLRLTDEADDFGPATKLLGCPTTAEACVLVTDDDAPRPDWWAALLLNQSGCAGRTARASKLVSGGVQGKRGGGDESVHLQGNRGFAFERSDLVSPQRLVAYYHRHKASCGSVDDQLFTRFFRENGFSIQPLCDTRPSSSENTRGRRGCRLLSDAELLLGNHFGEESHGLKTTKFKKDARYRVADCYRDTA